MRAASCPASRGLEPGGAAGLGEFAHPEDVALALGHRDHSARVEKVEDVARLRPPRRRAASRDDDDRPTRDACLGGAPSQLVRPLRSGPPPLPGGAEEFADQPIGGSLLQAPERP